MTPRPLRVAVLGPGAVGGLLAARLAAAGDAVVCVARPATVDVLASQGIRLDSDLFGSSVVPVDAATGLDRTVDVCVVAVKATTLDEALERVPPSVLAGGLLVPFLNGIEHLEVLRRRYPHAQVAAATIRVEALLAGPGVVRHVSPFARVELAGAPGDGALDRFGEHLAAAGLDVTRSADEVAALWSKFAFLAPLALLTTYFDAPIGVVRREQRPTLVALLAEVGAVGQAEGAPVSAESALAFTDALPAAMLSSMQRDAVAGRPTELDALGGALLRAAARHGLEVPVAAGLVESLSAR